MLGHQSNINLAANTPARDNVHCERQSWSNTLPLLLQPIFNPHTCTPLLPCATSLSSSCVPSSHVQMPLSLLLCSVPCLFCLSCVLTWLARRSSPAATRHEASLVVVEELASGASSRAALGEKVSLLKTLPPFSWCPPNFSCAAVLLQVPPITARGARRAN